MTTALNTSIPSILRLVHRSIAAAHQAGLEIRKLLESGDVEALSKPGHDGELDVYTAADLSSQCIIESSIRDIFPVIRIIGEEDDRVRDWVQRFELKPVLETVLDPFGGKECPDALKSVNLEDVIIWLDPMDGTSEFMAGLVEHVTILIGVALMGKPVAGIVHQPFWKSLKNDEELVGRTVWAIRGMGIGETVGTLGTPTVLTCHPFQAIQRASSSKTIVVTSRSHQSPHVVKAIESIAPDEVIYAGGCGNKVLMLLEGKANYYVYPSSGCKKWDTCGPEVLLNEAGGLLTDVFGSRYDYSPDVEHLNRLGVIASVCPNEQKMILGRIPEDVKIKLKG
ncbi:unnamed protein product [Notodromas monacha]|uniref:3'(2'),5'-bisphosphate nucleotidase 1 n=1 Tax=Notodromas monacha TaxID=399045 RepID=A0A7R9GDT6_9CRUS|nr:unnamed protein product [Notodromas monacha]CAG0917297.1 unnamed protein product [Notodromas monacha]